MKITLRALAIIIACGLSAYSQTAVNQHFGKDGLSFDYPASWKVSDQSTAQMQLIQLLRGDGYAEIRIRVPRESLKSPQKENEARKLIQEKYVEQFVDSLQQAGLKPTRAEATSEIAAGPAAGIRIRAMLEREPGGLDSFYRVVSERFVQLSQIGSEADMTRSLDAWDMLRKSLIVDASPASGSATGKP